MITRRKVSSILISLAALSQGAGALEAGNKPTVTALCACLLVSSSLTGLADAGESAAGKTGQIGRPLHFNGTGPAPAPRPGPAAAPTAAQDAAAPSATTRAFAAALKKYQETVYPAHRFANPDGSPIRAGQEIPPLEETAEPAPGTLADPLLKGPWATTLERVSALDRAVMDGLSEVLQAPAGKRLPGLEKRMETIKARSLELEAELREAAQDFQRARTAFAADYPGHALRSHLQDGLRQDPLDGQDPGDPEFSLQAKMMRLHLERVDFMGKALHRYLTTFLAATEELLPKFKPFPDEDARSAGKPPKGDRKAFVTRGGRPKDAPGDGRFSRRNEL